MDLSTNLTDLLRTLVTGREKRARIPVIHGVSRRSVGHRCRDHRGYISVIVSNRMQLIFHSVNSTLLINLIRVKLLLFPLRVLF